MTRRGWALLAALVAAPVVIAWLAWPRADGDGDMVLVPGGPFSMGSPAGEEDERPVHAVHLDAFYIDRYEVTNAQYAECAREGSCRPPAAARSETRLRYFGAERFDRYPVVGVTWSDAVTYCEWRGARLPTEAEWEKAARGTDGRAYPWGDAFERGRLNYCDRNCPLPWADSGHDDGFADTAPVDSFAEGASPYGAHNMAGNVWEWVEDRYDPAYYAVSPSENPRGPSAGDQRVMRGGGVFDDSYYTRSTTRRRFSPDVPSTSVGFRCARTA